MVVGIIYFTIVVDLIYFTIVVGIILRAGYHNNTCK